jgi:hypothetical protein
MAVMTFYRSNTNKSHKTAIKEITPFPFGIAKLPDGVRFQTENNANMNKFKVGTGTMETFLGNYPLWWLTTHFTTLECDWYSGLIVISSTMNHAMGWYHFSYGGDKSDYHQGSSQKTVSELICPFPKHYVAS